jgi:peroxiredoxin Q/BCP
MLIDEGKKAPAFSLNDQDGKTHRLADYAGRPVVLYFYPKDDTPGCTKESCQFRDNLPKFKKSKAAIFGMGNVRTTYLIGPDGKVAKRWDNVKVDGHAEEVLAAVQSL